jgi:hypothetical protein
MGDLGLSWHEFTSLKSQFGCSTLIFMPVLGLVHNTKRKLGRGARRTPIYIHFGGVDISVGGLGSTPSVRILDSTSALCTGFLACVCVSVSFASSTMMVFTGCQGTRHIGWCFVLVSLVGLPPSTQGRFSSFSLQVNTHSGDSLLLGRARNLYPNLGRGARRTPAGITMA